MNPNTVTCSFVMNRNLYNTYKNVVVHHDQNVKGNLVRYMQSIVQHGLPNIETSATVEILDATPDTVTCSFSLDRNLYNDYKSIVVKNGQNVKGNLVRYMQRVIQYGVPDIEEIVRMAEEQKNKLNLITVSFSVNHDLYDAYERIVQEHDWAVEESLIRYMEYVIQHGLPDFERLVAMPKSEEAEKNPE